MMISTAGNDGMGLMGWRGEGEDAAEGEEEEGLKRSSS